MPMTFTTVYIAIFVIVNCLGIYLIDHRDIIAYFLEKVVCIPSQVSIRAQNLLAINNNHSVAFTRFSY